MTQPLYDTVSFSLYMYIYVGLYKTKMSQCYLMEMKLSLHDTGWNLINPYNLIIYDAAYLPLKDLQIRYE